MNKKNKQKKIAKKNKGFTLIEVLVSLAMIMILTGTTLQVVRFSDTQKSLNIEANRFRSVIREAQSYALAIPNEADEHICGFGVYIVGVSNYYLFYTIAKDWETPGQECADCMGNLINEDKCGIASIGSTFVLPSEIVFESGDQDIFFKVPYGEVYQGGALLPTGGVGFTITHNTNSDTISVNELGKID